MRMSLLRLSLSPEETESVDTISLKTESTETECTGNESAVSNLIESAVSEYVLCKNCIFAFFNFYLTKNRLLTEREN